METISHTVVAMLAGLVVIVSGSVSAVVWLAVKPSEDKVRAIVQEELNKRLGTMESDVQLIKEILLKR